MSPKLEALLKTYDEWCDKNAKTPEQAEEGKQEMRRQLEKIGMERFQILALSTAITVAKAHSNKK